MTYRNEICSSPNEQYYVYTRAPFGRSAKWACLFPNYSHPAHRTAWTSTVHLDWDGLDPSCMDSINERGNPLGNVELFTKEGCKSALFVFFFRFLQRINIKQTEQKTAAVSAEQLRHRFQVPG